MHRRTVVVCGLALGAAVLGPATAQTARAHRIGFIGPTPAARPMADILRKALADLEPIDAQNLAIETRWPEGDQLDQLAEAARQLVEQKCELLVVVGATAARAARSVTTELPIVFVIAIDPVGTGLVASMERPGANLTGTTNYDPQQAARQLEMLKAALPGLTRVALLGDSGAAPTLFVSNERAAQTMGLQVSTVKVERVAAPDFDAAFEAAKREGAGAMLVLSTPVTTAHRRRIGELALKHRLPTLAPRDHADAAMLLSYGTSFAEATRLAASHVQRILMGSKPADLPVAVAARPELIVNLRTARELGVTLPAAVVSGAAQVIQ